MELAEYQGFTDSLTESLGGRPEVLGLVALGSMALRDYAPDRHSDHDFFVVTRLGAAEALRSDLSWLPDNDRISFSFRETAHGLISPIGGKLLSISTARNNRVRINAPNPAATIVSISAANRLVPQIILAIHVR